MVSRSNLQEDPVRRVFERAARIATTLTPARGVGLVRRSEDGWTLVASSGLEAAGPVSDRESPLLREARAQVVSSISRDDSVLRSWAPGLESCAVVPVENAGRTTLFLVTSPDRDAFDEPVLEPLQELAGLVGDAVSDAEATWTHSRHSDFLENVPVGVYRSTPDGRLMYANPRLADLFGVSSVEELKTIDLNDEGVAQVDRAAFKERVEEEGRIVQHETTWTRLDGGTVHVLESARAVRDEAGNIVYYEGIVEDITDRKETEEALRTEKHFIDSALNSLPGAFYLIDRDFRICRWNRELEEVAGYSAAEIERLNPLDLVIEEERERVADRIRQVFEEGAAGVETTVRTKDGERIPFYLTGARADIGGEPYLVGMGIDISERVAAEEAMKEAKQEAEEMNRLKSVFLANMSHEIRTPLTSILGFTDILEEEVDQDALRVVDMIRESGRRLKETLTSVLELARLEQDSTTVEAEWSNLADRVEDTVELMEPQIESNDLRLELALPGAPVYVRADPRVLHRVLTNLLSNAIKFTEEGTIRVVVERKDDEAVMQVSDTGIGIRDEFLDQVFDEFRQESEGLRRAHEGSGLGLTITKRLVELMGGTIEASSTKGEGSTFTVWLPCESEPRDVAKPPPSDSPPETQ